METTTRPPSLVQILERLARMEPVRSPLLSLYLNAQPDSRGKDNYAAFVRKELRRLVEDFPARSSERGSIERDAQAIERWLNEQVRPSANGIAIFACSATGFFEALELDAPIASHRLTIGDRPHLAALARIVDRYPRHAVVLADTNHAHIYVFGRGRTIEREELRSEKVSHTDTGGWSQLRYQRHVEDHYLHHAKELVERLGRIVAEERAEYVLLSGDDVIVPLLRSQLSKELARKVVGVLRLDIRTPENEVMKAAGDALSAYVAEEEAKRIKELHDEWRGGGLAVAGTRKVLEALGNGQADEVWIATKEGEADEIVQRALATSASVRFVEDAGLLAEMAGVVARLRYKAGISPMERKAEA